MRAHAQAIAEDGSAGKRTRRIDGNDADGLARFSDLGRQAIDERALAGARRSRHSDEVRAAGAAVDAANELGAGGNLVFDERDRTRDRAWISGEHTLRNIH
jgi:hypothetical protein